MRAMTNNLREQIQMRTKNRLDISDLIQGVSIKGENLSHSIIKYLDRVKEDLTNIDFSYCLLGSDDKIFSIIQCDISNSNFENAKFVGKAFVRSCKAHNCNFKGADVSKADYQNSDFTNSDFCNSIITIGTSCGKGAKFSKSFFHNLMNGWNTKFKIVDDDKESGD